MKEQLQTIPVNDAMDAGDECPFCHLQRRSEQRTIRYVAGPSASYMEPDVRAITDRHGFCADHTKKLYDYGNTLGAALMLQTHLAGILEEFRQEMEQGKNTPKKPLFGKAPKESDYPQRILDRVHDCYICRRMEADMQRYYKTFFVMIKDPEFRQKVEESKGFCMKHFAQLIQHAKEELPGSQHQWFYQTAYRIMEENLTRVKQDLDWLIDKYDYRNVGADWKNSRDALPRTMQKLQGLYPADKPYVKD